MKKTALYISAFTCLMGFTACEKTETALTEDETQTQSTKTQTNTQKPIKITAGNPARSAPASETPTRQYTDAPQKPVAAKPS